MQPEMARESELIQNTADVLHQHRQVQTQLAQEWLHLAQKIQVAFLRLFNVATILITSSTIPFWRQRR